MIDIWFEVSGDLLSVNCTSVFTARLTWDMLNKGGAKMVSTRP